METVQNSTEHVAEPGRLQLFIGQLSWRMILVRLVVNGLTLIAVAILVPNIYFVDRTLVSVLIMAVALGLLNAFVKPVVQFLTLPFIFATYGFAVVVINTILLLILAWIFKERFFVGSLAAAILGGLVMGVFASLLESLLGLDLPIVPGAQGAVDSQASASQTIAEVLVDEMAGDEAQQTTPSGQVSEPTPLAEQAEPAITDTAEESSVLADDEEPAATVAQDEVEPSDETDDEQPGDVT